MTIDSRGESAGAGATRARRSVSVNPSTCPNVDEEGLYSLAEDSWKVGDPHPNDGALWAVKIKLKVPIFKGEVGEE